MKSPDQKKVEAHKHISLFLACFSISSIIFKNSVAAESTTTFFDILFGRNWVDSLRGLILGLELLMGLIGAFRSFRGLMSVLSGQLISLIRCFWAS